MKNAFKVVMLLTVLQFAAVARAELKAFVLAIPKVTDISTQHVTNKATLMIAAGAMVRIDSVAGSGSLVYRNGTNSFDLGAVSFGNGSAGGAPKPSLPLLLGPAELDYQTVASYGSDARFYLVVEITQAAADVSSVPNGVVVIPQDATGPVDIILEASSDLINWAGALPGTYGSSSSQRFFRVRAVRR